MRRSHVTTAVVCLLGFCPLPAAADQWDSILSSEQRVSCGPHRLALSERARLYRLFAAVATANAVNGSARQYVENELGLTSEIGVSSVRREFLILDSGSVLHMFDTSGFEAGSSYLADDDYLPDQVLDGNGDLQDVMRAHSDIQEALGEE